VARQSPARSKLTARTLDALPIRAASYDVFDTELRGFHVRVHPSGILSFALRYRDPAGGTPPRYHRFTIGRYGELTPDAARTIAQAKRAEIQAGANPVRDERLRKSALSFDDAIMRYVAHLTDTRSVRYAAESKRLLRSHCAPLAEPGQLRRDPESGARENWGPRPLASITRAEILELHQRMRSTPTLANRVVATLSALFGFASKQGWPGVHLNPVTPRPHYKETSRGRVLSDGDAARLGEALRTAEKNGTPWQAIGIIRLAFLTGMRREEATQLRWDAIDVKHARVVLAESKTGRSERPLGAATITLLDELRAKAPKRSPFVFPSPDDPKTHYQNAPKHWARIRLAAGLADVRFHDLRHDVATETGMRYPLSVLMAVTGHADAATASKYIHQHDDPTKRAADDVTQRRADKLVAPVPKEGTR
jgi:integrase